MMGSGKTTVGKILADEINFKFIDSDDLIEKQEDKSITDIFLFKGEEYFRELEKNFFSETPNNNNELYLNLLDIFDKYDNTIYVDKAHTSNGGYKLMSEKICAEIFKNSEFLKK